MHGNKKIIWLIIGLAIFVVALSMVSFFLYGRPDIATRYSGVYPSATGFPGRFAFIIMPVMAIISILILILFVRFIMRMAGGSSCRRDMIYDNSEAILRERYAKGEISEEEYKTRLNNLKNH
ncbi:hypothetical protein FAD_0486 [Ferroplasma acidiphilum]|uniref:SHOCT domain-containing protein n=1 Tax=Ferroplasma acidiphilum TaxID=74969 RepID=A0A1V0N2L2_9ARCH|nr:SHOCT domain-containing protein [Ferroplasma acidiphilum]ARD84400.1 hypothetical protein FAD_0486 [Ferroplasma acidiphilum]